MTRDGSGTVQRILRYSPSRGILISEEKDNIRIDESAIS